MAIWPNQYRLANWINGLCLICLQNTKILIVCFISVELIVDCAQSVCVLMAIIICCLTERLSCTL